MWVYLIGNMCCLVDSGIRLPIFNMYLKIHQTNLVTGINILESSDVFFMRSIEGKLKKKKKVVYAYVFEFRYKLNLSNFSDILY